MKIPKPTALDFETFAIAGRPAYPPAPVSVSIKPWGKKARFYAWGHPTGNNCTLAEARAAVAQAYATPDGILCHHAKFDIDVAEVHLGLAPPDWRKIHETVFLLFLDNPHGQDYALKPSAQRVLGWAPEERDAVYEWLRANFVPAEGKVTKLNFGAYISQAPGDVVGPYANGDVDRTAALFKHLYPRVVEAGMLRAYDRERELMPILLDMERRGIRVDLDRLRTDVASYRQIRTNLDAWVRKRLRCGPEVNLQAGGQLLTALQEAGLVDTSKMLLTKKDKKISTNKESLALGVTDKQLAAVLAYDAQLHTCLSTFMGPWLATAEQSGGLIFTHWNQTPSERGGTRTGRFSSTPNFQNLPKEFAPLFAEDEVHLSKAERKGLPKQPFKLRPLPLCRSYVVPMFEDHVLVGRDYCFSGDTEILTEKGFVRFDRLKKGLPVAQWIDGEITFVQPLAYQQAPSFGKLSRIVGDNCDLLVSPSHNCLLFDAETYRYEKIPAASYPTGGGRYHQPVLDYEKSSFTSLESTCRYQLTEEPYGGLVYCVTVPSGVIVVRRNGKVMVTGQSQQEPRILAHFEDGVLMEQYQANPWIDYHDNAKEHLERIFHRPFKRKPVKTVNLGLIYGQGVASLAAKNGESYAETKQLKDAIFSMYPGLRDMYQGMRLRAKAHEPIRTWGGRVYYCEPPAIVNGRILEFDYKMVNVLVQGSAADCTKEAMIRYAKAAPPNHFLLLSVHDELVLSCPRAELQQGIEVLRQVMESVEFDVQILSEGAWSAANWASMIDYDKKGKLVNQERLPR